jgi:hypothetical protein
MKQPFAVIAAVALAVGLSSPFASIVAETNRTYATIMAAAASNDVHGVLQALPSLEKLWPQEPVLYFQAAQPVAEVLAAASSNMVVRQALWTLFDQLLEKTCPTNNEQALACFNFKDKAVTWFFNFTEIIHDRTRLVQVAGFLGEIRSQRIPNYKNRSSANALQGVGISLYLNPTNPVLQEAYAKAVEDGEQNHIMDELQRTLSVTDMGLTLAILRYGSHLLDKKNPRFIANDQQNAEFIEQLVAAAHLTDDEISRLRGKLK